MSQYTEDDLRAVFAENSVREAGSPPRLNEIRRRGARTRLRRRVATGAAVAALAGAAATVVPLTGAVTAWRGEPATGVTASFAPDVELPRTLGTRHGPVSLISGQTYRTVGERVRITFRPTSVHTGIALRCADPKAWVLIRDVKGSWNDLTPCVRLGQGLQVQYDESSVTPDWLRAPQSLEVWVFPADAPIGSPTLADKCALADRRAGTCDGPWDREAIAAMPERLAAETGSRRGLWSIAIYDADPPSGS
ncbi:hypothetical protein FE391_24100 [Nonomuraea sp. KC401]|uniref:hypothetical protein n=1 Tax=unclassified Nonomuraea TaxID=2593643 RepID=UPI0010FE8DE2|nr:MULTISPECIES: hypothetical protein [unclassified Nonomuraea]NBE96853.1 hypothetical protein [Nonomuraea sp. K271]TLF66481.1 hypothetical protein FE391_24100 [Nonomuraea sp. KC401]